MIDVLAWMLLLAAAMPLGVLAIELAVAHLDAPPLPRAETPRLAVLVPAHDEAEGIAAMLATLRPSLPAGARLIVIADNCRDDTAALARACGAEVFERTDPVQRGKAFAVAFARDRLRAEPPEAVVIVDADCAVEGDGIARLAAAAKATGRPVQSTYLLRPRPELGTMIGLSGFAFLVRNLVRQRALARLGVPAMLTGSGVAFPWDVFRDAPLATSALAEDYAISIALVRKGDLPAFLPEVATWSDPASPAATAGQRRRWEQGSVRNAFATAPGLLTSGRGALVWLGLHLLVPPLALLVLVELAVLALLGVQAALGATPIPFAILAMLIALLAVLLLAAWARFGRTQISGARLLLIPFYILWKLPLYLAALVRPEREWLRTGRD